MRGYCAKSDSRHATHCYAAQVRDLITNAPLFKSAEEYVSQYVQQPAVCWGTYCLTTVCAPPA